MKTIGLIGGMSWESTADYYRLLNEGVRERLGGLHSADLIMHSIDFHELETLQHQNRWDEAEAMMVRIAVNLEKAGAQLMVIGSNTMHITAEAIQRATSIPLIHIADATGAFLKAHDVKSPALLGTRFTMEKPFYKNRVLEKFDIAIQVPNVNDRKLVHDVIYNELCLGVINESSKREYLSIIDSMKKQGADAVIAGCTEVPLLIKQKDLDIPFADTTAIHVKAILDAALE